MISRRGPVSEDHEPEIWKAQCEMTNAAFSTNTYTLSWKYFSKFWADNIF